MTTMHIVDDLAALSAALDGGPGAVVTIGVYDGVHLGHHAVLRLVRELADARGLAAVCVTFDRHPAEVVRPESAPKLLTTPEQPCWNHTRIVDDDDIVRSQILRKLSKI